MLCSNWALVLKRVTSATAGCLTIDLWLKRALTKGEDQTKAGGGNSSTYLPGIERYLSRASFVQTDLSFGHSNHISDLAVDRRAACVAFTAPVGVTTRAEVSC